MIQDRPISKLVLFISFKHVIDIRWSKIEKNVKNIKFYNYYVIIIIFWLDFDVTFIAFKHVYWLQFKPERSGNFLVIHDTYGLGPRTDLGLNYTDYWA